MNLRDYTPKTHSELLKGAACIKAYLEQGPCVQGIVRELLGVLEDDDTQDGEVAMTLYTLEGALFDD